MKHGPSRGEHRFRLAVGVGGLGLLGHALATRPAHDIAWIEVAVLAGGFFGWTAFASARALARDADEKDEDG
jgi:hypothetical protein